GGPAQGRRGGLLGVRGTRAAQGRQVLRGGDAFGDRGTLGRAVASGGGRVAGLLGGPFGGRCERGVRQRRGQDRGDLGSGRGRRGARPGVLLGPHRPG